MIEINLLPSGAARRPAAAPRGGRGGLSLPRVGGDPRVAAMGGAAALLLGFGAFYFWNSGNRLEALRAQVDQAAQDSVRLERTIGLMKTLDTRRDTIDRKIEVIRQVDGRRYVWPHLMDEVSRATPPYMWLTRLAAAEDDPDAAPATPVPAATAPADTAKARADSAAAALAVQTAEDAGPSFNIEGNAGSTQALTRFMRNLESSPMIAGVALVTSEQTEVQGRSVLKFTLEARWEQPDPAFVQTVPLIPAR